MKRIQLVPLVLLLWCGGVSLASGLYYYDSPATAYLFPVALIMGVYYLFRMVFRDYKSRDLLSCGSSFALSLVSLFFLRKLLIPGLWWVLNSISYKVFMSYHISLGYITVNGEGSEALAISQLIVWITILSLFLYETDHPAVVTALPSFLLFIVSIIADGVPYEACVITYAGALIVFLGMGRFGESVQKFLLLAGCTAVTVAVVGLAFSWADVSQQMWKYRTRLVSDRFGGSTRSEYQPPEGERQRLDFGQFNSSGNITYNGTIELYVTSTESFQEDELFLRGFIGQFYYGNQWYGAWMLNRTDTDGDIFLPKESIKIAEVFDQGVYVPFAPEQDRVDALMERSSTNLWDWNEELYNAMEVDPEMEVRIQDEIIRGQSHETVGESIDIVKDYYSQEFQYTLNPGPVDYEVDEIEKFLFTTKRGYCTHFASAAVMIFRSMQIPARLAQGYMISGNTLKKDVQVNVYDYNAHAWVEIYVDGQGWMPLDVTSYVPGGSVAENADELGVGQNNITPEELRREMEQRSAEERAARAQQAAVQAEKQHQEMEDEEGDQSQQEPEEDDSETQPKPGAGSGSADGIWDTIWQTAQPVLKYGLPIALLALLTVSVWRYRRRRRMKREMSEGELRRRLCFINDCLGSFWREIGSPWDYLDSDRLAKSIFRQTSRYYIMETSDEMLVLGERTRRYVRCVYDSRFGSEDISEEAYEESMAYLLEMFRILQKNAPERKWKKLRKCRMVKMLHENTAERRGKRR